MTVRICVWSGPRNISTALMYAFAQRPDTRVVDEPHYGHYLARTGVEHPGREEVLATMDRDGDRVTREVVLGPCDRSVLFCKEMAHHLPGLDRSFLGMVSNAILTRSPDEMLPSLAHQIPEPTLRDTGYELQCELLRDLVRMGQDVPVIDAARLRREPDRVLRALCSRLGLPFFDRMLRWEVGGRPEDGIWAPHWYANLHRTTGFLPPSGAVKRPVRDRLRPLLAACEPLYAELSRDAI